jgi:predicted amidohydrolase YtcJ
MFAIGLFDHGFDTPEKELKHDGCQMLTRNFLISLFGFFLVFSGFLDPAQAAAPVSNKVVDADLVITGASICKMDAVRSWASALAVKNGKIVFVGDDFTAQQYMGSGTRVQKLHGEMILPGFHDCHVHPVDSGMDQARCVLDSAESSDQMLSLISAYAKHHESDIWIIGSGWSLPLFADANPSKKLLDAIVPDKPAFFLSQDAHSAWVNTQALKLAGITKDSPDPALGKIERDTTGEPTGTLRESAIDLFKKFLPEPSLEERKCGLLFALKMANSFGITSLQDARVTKEYLEAYQAVERDGKLTVRVVAALYVDPEKDASQVNELIRLRNAFSTDLVKPTSAKIFADGVVESHTAALLEPYTDKQDQSGTLNFPPEKLREIVIALHRNGFQVHVHAIGDRAVNEALNAFQVAQSLYGSQDNRHQIAHLQLIKPSDIGRFKALGVIANFQALWAYFDPYIAKCTLPVLGEKRTSRNYQLNSVHKTGAVIAAGSDWSVSSMNPLDAIQVAVTRKALDAADSQSAWTPFERMELGDMIAAYTINGAYCNHEENLVGSLEVDKVADFVVLNKNLFDVPENQIHNVRVVETFFRGKSVYRSAELVDAKP